MSETIEVIKKDIIDIDDALESGDIERLIRLHTYLDGKYQTVIFDWGMSMYGFNPNFGFDEGLLDKESLIHNLLSMKAKIEAYGLNWNRIETPKSDNISTEKSDYLVPNLTFHLSNTNTNNNSINLNLSFDQARYQIEEMTALSKEQTNKKKKKINEIESISKEKEPKKKKWEKVKPILGFALDKGVDIAIMLWSLALQSGFMS